MPESPFNVQQQIRVTSALRNLLTSDLAIISLDKGFPIGFPWQYCKSCVIAWPTLQALSNVCNSASGKQLGGTLEGGFQSLASLPYVIQLALVWP